MIIRKLDQYSIIFFPPSPRLRNVIPDPDPDQGPGSSFWGDLKFLYCSNFKYLFYMIKRAFRIKCCWGLESGKCPNLLLPDPDLKSAFEAICEHSDWAERLRERLSREFRPLDQFSISVSGCPNGCSRPQIVDFGFI